MRLWDVQDSELRERAVLQVPDCNTFIYSVAFSPDSKRLAGACDDGRAEALDGDELEGVEEADRIPTAKLDKNGTVRRCREVEGYIIVRGRRCRVDPNGESVLGGRDLGTVAGDALCAPSQAVCSPLSYLMDLREER